MKRVKRGVAVSCVKQAQDVPNVLEEDVIPVRVLRSHKRKLAEVQCLEEAKQAKKPNRKGTTSNDVPDCVVLNEITAANSSNSKTGFNGLFTSTPLNGLRSRKPKFEESCIKAVDEKPVPDKCANDVKENTDVIVISDSSVSTLQVIVLSDEEKGKSDTDIEIISPGVKKEKTPKKSPGASRSRLSSRGCLRKCLDNNKPTLALPRPALALSKRISRNKIGKFRKRDRHFKQRKSPVKSVRQEVKAGSEPHIGENLYFDSPIVLPKVGLRPIIIDGSNVAFYHSNNSYFSCKGLEICIKYFKKRGHQVTAFVPHFRVQHNKSDNPKLLDRLVKTGDVVLTPSRMVDGNRIVSYDDRFIVQTAALKGGIIVTRDNYRDLLAENPAWAETIKYRLLQFTWVQDLLIFPKDPLGERGPTLDEFLRFG